MVIENDRDWEKDLKEKYPELLNNIYLECGEGWKTIIEDVCEQILTHESILESSGVHVVKFEDEITDDDDYCQVRIHQVKQKFGEFIMMAAIISFKTLLEMQRQKH